MENNNYIWIKNGSQIRKIQNFDVLREIPKKIYTIGYTQREGYFLTEFADEFTFPYRIYGIGDIERFINYVMRTIEGTPGNVGILLNGIKGTGKTITAEILANQIGLPVIMVDDPGSIEFVKELNFPCTLFFDEYEKKFSEKSDESSILSILDGVYTTTDRKICIFTTNTKGIDDNLLCRPGRIRYVKNFNELPGNVVDEVVDDLLEDKSLSEKVKSLAYTFSILTIDILKAVITEVNIHGNCFDEIREWMNIDVTGVTYQWFAWRASDRLGYQGDEEYTLDKFKENISLIGKKNESGEIYEAYSFDIRVGFTKSGKNITDYKVGDVFDDAGVISEIDLPYITLSDKNSPETTCSFIKILNHGDTIERVASWKRKSGLK